MEIYDKNTGLDFTAEIEKFYDDFPEYRDVVFIINPDIHENVDDFLEKNPEFVAKQKEYQDPYIMRQNGVELKDFQKFQWCVFNKQHAEEHFVIGGVYTTILDIKSLVDYSNGDTSKSNLAGLIVPRKNINNVEDGCDIEVLQKHVLYHEMGHALYEQENKKAVLSYYVDRNKQFRYETEAAAECYSLIKLVQEYGVDNPTIDYLFKTRTLDRLKIPESEYNFLPVMHEVINLSQKGKLDNLTANENVKLAHKIVRDKVISFKDSQEIDRKFWHTYSSLRFGKPVLDFARKNIMETKNQVVINDIQYILKCLEHTTANDPQIQAVVKDTWKAIKANKAVKKQGLLTQHWQADKSKPMNKLKRKFGLKW